MSMFILFISDIEIGNIFLSIGDLILKSQLNKNYMERSSGISSVAGN